MERIYHKYRIWEFVTKEERSELSFRWKWHKDLHEFILWISILRYTLHIHIDVKQNEIIGERRKID